MQALALDMGHEYWIVSRVDAQGRPQIANLGENGLFHAVVSEFEGQAVFGEWISDEQNILPIHNILKCLERDPETLQQYGEYARLQPSGELDFFLENRWLSIEQIFAKLLQVMLQKLSPTPNNKKTPLVLSYPSDISKKTLHILKNIFEHSTCELLLWVNQLQAIVLGSKEAYSSENEKCIVILMKDTSCHIGLLDVWGGIPLLLNEKTIHWDSFTTFSTSSLLKQLKELSHLDPKNDFAKIFLLGEGHFLELFEEQLEMEFASQVITLPNPSFAAIFGLVQLLTQQENKTYLMTFPETSNKEQLRIVGFLTPGIHVTIECGLQRKYVDIRTTGLLDELILLQQDASNDILFQLKSKGEESQITKNVFFQKNKGGTNPDIELPHKIKSSVELMAYQATSSFEGKEILQSLSKANLPIPQFPSSTLNFDDETSLSSSNLEPVFSEKEESSTSIIAVPQELFDDIESKSDLPTHLIEQKELEPKPTAPPKRISEEIVIQNVSIDSQISTFPEPPIPTSSPKASSTPMLGLEPQVRILKANDLEEIEQDTSNIAIETNLLEVPKKATAKPLQQSIANNQFNEGNQEVALQIQSQLENISDLFQQWLETTQPSYQIASVQEDELDVIEMRELKKSMETAKAFLEFPSQRLSVSSQKIIARLTEQLEESIHRKEIRNSMFLALQLSNRLFEMIRKDLKSW